MQVALGDFARNAAQTGIATPKETPHRWALRFDSRAHRLAPMGKLPPLFFPYLSFSSLMFVSNILQTHRARIGQRIQQLPYASTQSTIPEPIIFLGA